MDARVADAAKKPAAAGKPSAYKPEWFSKWVPAAEQRHAALPDKYLNAEFKANSLINSPVLGGNAWAFIHGNTVYAVSRRDCTELWRVRLPSAALMNGMSLTRAGDVLVALDNGCVVCIGTPAAAPAATSAKEAAPATGR